MSTPAAEDLVAAQLVAARREGRSLTRFPGVVPASMAEAYQIQELAMSRWQDSLVGWKIGYIPADRRTAGEPDRLVGPIWRQQYHVGEEQVPAAEVGIFASGFAAVEAELVIRLGQDLPAHDGRGWTAEEAADLEQHLLVGVEVASSPIPEINSLGPTVIDPDRCQLQREALCKDLYGGVHRRRDHRTDHRPRTMLSRQTRDRPSRHLRPGLADYGDQAPELRARCEGPM